MKNVFPPGFPFQLFLLRSTNGGAVASSSSSPPRDQCSRILQAVVAVALVAWIVWIVLICVAESATSAHSYYTLFSYQVQQLYKFGWLYNCGCTAAFERLLFRVVVLVENPLSVLCQVAGGRRRRAGARVRAPCRCGGGRCARLTLPLGALPHPSDERKSENISHLTASQSLLSGVDRGTCED